MYRQIWRMALDACGQRTIGRVHLLKGLWQIPRFEMKGKVRIALSAAWLDAPTRVKPVTSRNVVFSRELEERHAIA